VEVEGSAGRCPVKQGLQQVVADVEEGDQVSTAEPVRRANPDRSAAAAAATLTFLFLDSLVLAQGALAYRAHFLTLSQMKAAGVAQGLPFVWHFGMWGDFFVISPMAAYLVGRYAHLHQLRRGLLSFGIGVAGAAFFGWLWTFSSTPEAHVQNHHLTAAGAVHLVYMAVVIAVFVHFILFNSQVSGRLLAVASSLVLIHVFAGTHMLLGLLTTLAPQAWYPDRPLRSVSGWLTLIALAIGLAWLNLGKASASYGGPGGIFDRVAGWYMSWIGGEVRRGKVRTPRGLLAFLDSIGGYAIEFTLFASAAVKAWDPHDCLRSRHANLGAAVTCIWQALLPAVLALVFGFVYHLSRRSVKQELQIADEVFPPPRQPTEWISSRDPVGITLSVIGFFLLYISLALFFADDIHIASAVMMVIASIDYNTRRLINKRMDKYLDDEEYAPAPGDRDADLIERRRQVAREFLFDRPHLRKEAARILGCAVAFVLALAGRSFHAEILTVLAYLVLIATLLANEWLVHRWRRRRDRALDDIRAEADARPASGR